ncbi:MAG: metallophosphoesterase [Proteobacteria bacterium]|nr:metallophosphoesterase [Pseudomonadota bacterium]
MALAILLLPLVSAADVTGVVFVDLDGDGSRGPGEPGQSSVAVSNGREVAKTDAAGRYRLPDSGPRGLVFVTRPAGFECADWYKRGAGDFALVPRAAPERDFFFVQLSDPHVYDQPAHFVEEYELEGPWWAPRFLVAWYTLRRLREAVVPRFTDDVIGGLRRALPPGLDVADAGDVAIYLAYLDEFQRPGSELGDIPRKIERAFGEIAALRPTLVVATGDLVLDANGSSQETLDVWMDLYRRGLLEIESTGATVYSTIGNHDLRGIRHRDEGDPLRGLGSFEAAFGPSSYSFDRGGFRFVALDTHRLDPGDDDGTAWAYNELRDDVRRWLRADLNANAGVRAIVLMNHEPFFADPSLPFDGSLVESHVVDLDDLLGEFGVAYTLTGHTHFPGSQRGDPTTHISAGSLTGLGWFLPQEVYPSGYRLVYARDGRLYSAWKEVGRALVGFVQPAGDAAIDPVSAHSVTAETAEGFLEVVGVAADASGPFALLSLELDGEPVPAERWGAYFLRARIEPSRGTSPRTLVLKAVRDDGSTETARLDVATN